MNSQLKHPKRLGAVLAVTVIIAIIVSYGIAMRSSAAPDPSPSTSPIQSETTNRQGWPNVDWDYWRNINPDICAWITIPGTPIDFPVVQASAEDPDFYLKHDIYGNWNIWGTPFLEATNASTGILGAQAAWIFSHNMLDGSMFEPIVDYIVPEFMSTHTKVWIQVPSGTKRSYDVYAAEVVRGSDLVKRTDFKNRSDFKSWRDVRFVNAENTGSVRSIDANKRASRVLALVTCSHNFWKNERTVVYCMPSADYHQPSQ